MKSYLSPYQKNHFQKAFKILSKVFLEKSKYLSANNPTQMLPTSLKLTGPNSFWFVLFRLKDI